MTTIAERTTLPLISSTTPRELWNHPTLDLFSREIQPLEPEKAKLYKSPSTFGESFDSDDQLIPTSASELPDIRIWTMALAASLLEIYAGRRQPAQVAMRLHRVIYSDLLTQIGGVKEVGRIFRIHQNFPFDGIAESALTIKYSDRFRALAIRAEGVNGRWICTALELI